MPDWLQRAIGLACAVLTAPLVAILATAILLDTRGPALHRTERVGRGGDHFTCLKLRTMQVGTTGPAITVDQDPRITRVGRWIRRSRLDELPQFWNVARGEMRLVGPRPEAPAFVDLADVLHRRIFTSTPGMTGLAQLVFVDEAKLLTGPDPDARYRRVILPVKLQIDAAYLDHRTLRLDLWILGRTAAAVLGQATPHREIEYRLGVDLPELR